MGDVHRDYGKRGLPQSLRQLAATLRGDNVTPEIYPVHFDEAADLIESLTDQLEIAKAVITEANNSAYGSQGYFITTANGEVVGAKGVTDPPDKYHLAKKIEALKAQSNRDYNRASRMESAIDHLLHRVPIEPGM